MLSATQASNKPCSVYHAILFIFKGRFHCYYLSVEPVSELKIVVQHKSKYVEVNETITIVVINDKNVTFSEYKYERHVNIRHFHGNRRPPDFNSDITTAHAWP